MKTESNECGQDFKSKSISNEHKFSSDGEEKPRKKLFKCEISFLQKAGLKGHISSVHEKKKPYKCRICYSSFADHYDIKFHIASVHEGKKQFEYVLCTGGRIEGPHVFSS